MKLSKIDDEDSQRQLKGKKKPTRAPLANSSFLADLQGQGGQDDILKVLKG